MELIVKKMIAAVSSLTLLSASAFAAAPGDGTVKFTGEIVDAPCAISTDSQYQEVVLGQVAKTVFKAVGDKSPSKEFKIKLEGCDISGKNKVTVSFSGMGDTTKPDMLALTNEVGAATGVAIGIYDNANQAVDLNTGKSPNSLAAGQTVLYYSANYVATKDAVTTGYGNASVDFNVTYE